MSYPRDLITQQLCDEFSKHKINGQEIVFNWVEAVDEEGNDLSIEMFYPPIPSEYVFVREKTDDSRRTQYDLYVRNTVIQTGWQIDHNLYAEQCNMRVMAVLMGENDGS
jgi:hypothetical protein